MNNTGKFVTLIIISLLLIVINEMMIAENLIDLKHHSCYSIYSKEEHQKRINTGKEKRAFLISFTIFLIIFFPEE